MHICADEGMFTTKFPVILEGTHKVIHRFVFGGFVRKPQKTGDLHDPLRLLLDKYLNPVDNFNVKKFLHRVI